MEQQCEPVQRPRLRVCWACGHENHLAPSSRFCPFGFHDDAKHSVGQQQHEQSGRHRGSSKAVAEQQQQQQHQHDMELAHVTAMFSGLSVTKF